MAPQVSDFKCEVIVPERTTALHDVVSRWSDSQVELPALVVKPETETDILDAIAYAKSHGLVLIPAGGKHAAFVPIDPKTLYLDLTKFNKVTLDKSSGLAHIEGGALVGDVVKTLAFEGYYAPFPNSDTIGYVGSLLGGGFCPFLGLHGCLSDGAVSIRIITAQGQTLDVSASSSSDDEKQLFNALCGAGIGLGVVIRVTVRAHLLSSLNLSEGDKIWTRKLVFGADAIDSAAEAYTKFQALAHGNMPPALMVYLLIARFPPGSPAPGSPMAVLAAAYHGPANEAEEATSALFSDEELAGRAVMAQTALVPLTEANKVAEFINVHGGFKGIASTYLLNPVRASTILAAFQRWQRLGEECPDALGTILNFASLDTRKSQELGGGGAKGRFVDKEVRERWHVALAIGWCTQEESRAVVAKFEDDVLSAARAGDQSGTPAPRTILNNLRPSVELTDLQTAERLAELKRIKHVWDAEKVFWSPFA